MRNTRISKVLGLLLLLLAAVVALQSPILYAASEQAIQPPIVPLTSHASSLNWAGYSASSGTYTSVSGSWVVPKVANIGVGRADAAWVGIGGLTSHDLIQAGTQAVVTRHGVEYQAWYEMLPDVSTPVDLAVSPGDSITTSITETGLHKWRIVIHNNTTGGEYSDTFEYDSSHSSAEWIEERVSALDGSFYPLNDFGSITFESALAQVDGEFKTLSQLGAKPVTMTNGTGQVLAATSELDAEGNFTVHRSSQNVTTPTFAVEPTEEAITSLGLGGDEHVLVITVISDGITVERASEGSLQSTQSSVRQRPTYHVVGPSASASLFDLLWR